MEKIYKDYKYKKNPWTVIRSDINLGFGGGVVFASKFIKEDFICWMPGNMKIKPIEALKLIEIEKNKEKNLLVKAKRINRPLFDTLKTKIFSLIFSLYFKEWLFDIGGTPNILEKNILTTLNYSPNDFSFDAFIYYFAIKNNFRIKRPKVSYKKRLFGRSHWQKGLASELNLTYKILSQKNLWKKEAFEYLNKTNNN